MKIEKKAVTKYFVELSEEEAQDLYTYLDNAISELDKLDMEEEDRIHAVENDFSKKLRLAIDD